MNPSSPYRHEEEEEDNDGEDVFLEESDIIQEIPVDEEGKIFPFIQSLFTFFPILK